MNRDEQARRNLGLAEGFLKHLLEHPDALDRMHDGMAVVHVPTDDAELSDANLATAREPLQRRPVCAGHKGAVEAESESEPEAEAESDEGVYLQPVR